ncbi:MAG TPA: DUF4129 domain-containing protein [Puia sp.]|nr:DUF4129 domain-containing protein [Puia sp.]
MMSPCRTGILLLFFLSVGCLRVAAQAGGRSDTATGDTVVVGDEGAGTGTVQNDSVYDTGAATPGSAGDSLVVRSVPDSMVAGWKKDPDFAYANDPRYWQRQQEEDRSVPAWLIRLLSSAAFRYGIYIILGALLIYAIGRIMAENHVGIFYRQAKRSGARQEQAAGESMTDEDLGRRLQESLANGDYRLAVRYCYLRSLRRLDERGLIRYHGQATNQGYLRLLAGTMYEAPFRLLTQAYEKVWYGHFGLGEDTFRRLHGYFMEFDKTLQG